MSNCGPACVRGRLKEGDRNRSLKVNPEQAMGAGPLLNPKEREAQGAGQAPSPFGPASPPPAHTYLLLNTLL